MGREYLLCFFVPSSLKTEHCCPLSLWWDTKESAQHFSCKCVSLKDGGLLVYEVQLSRVLLFTTPWTKACQASLSITNPWNLVKLVSKSSVTPSNHLILCHTLLLPPSIFPSIRVFSNESCASLVSFHLVKAVFRVLGWGVNEFCLYAIEICKFSWTLCRLKIFSF